MKNRKKVKMCPRWNKGLNCKGHSIFAACPKNTDSRCQIITPKKSATVTVKAFCRLYNKGRFIKNSIWADNVNKTGIPCVIMIEEKHLEGWKP